MKKTFTGVLMLLLLSLLVFFVYSFFTNSDSVATFIQYTTPSLRIQSQLIDSYEKSSAADKEEIEKIIIQTVLHSIQYEKWEEFIDYIELKLYRNNILPNESEQLIVVLNLTKDVGVIAIFDQVNSEYIYHSKIENLVVIEDIKFLPVSSHSHNMMAIYQVLDERFGSFFIEHFVQIYLHMPQGFKNLWQKSLYYEEIYKEVWVNPQASEDLWNKVIEETVLDYVISDPLKINTLTTLTKYTARSKETPADQQFSLVSTDSYKRSYYWSPDYNTFVLGEVTRDVFLTQAALLEDMEIRREKLFGIQNQNYKVITSKGELLYLPKNKFKGIFQNLIEE